jgi:hypothetical protein
VVGALFDSLHDVAQVLTEHIHEETGIQDAQPGPPRPADATTEPAARITLLYTTPQPGHRSDPAEQGPGGLRPPPLSLSCFYLVTTSGADSDDPVGAHHALGQIMRLYHDSPVLRLPLSDDPGSPPGVFTELGEGELTVTQVPITLEQIDHIWTPLTEALQPWVLFEVAPVQLVSRRPDVEAPGVVRPGGVRLDQPIGQRPRLLRSAPQPVRVGGRVRLDAVAASAVDTVWVGGLRLAAGTPALSTAPAREGVFSVVVDLSAGDLAMLGPGEHRVTLSVAGLASRTDTIRLVDGVPGLDAPAAAVPHDSATDLVVRGAGLGAVQEVLAWPDDGIRAPTDVHSLPFSIGGPGSLTVRSAAGLADLPGAVSTWRLAARLAGQRYTPFVVVELAR